MKVEVVINWVRPVTSRLVRLLPGGLRQSLRGEHHSIEYRFLYNPLEQLSLRLHRVFGGTYLSWYAQRLDGHVKDRFAEGEWSRESPEYRAWLQTGGEDLAVCRHFGLKPEHSLFEFGTGHGLASKFFIEYLNPGNFVGNDSSGERLRIARLLLKEYGVGDKKTDLIHNADNSMDWLNGRKFDFIWCFAVFVHVPPEDVEEIITNFRKAMTENTICLFSYTEKVGVEGVDQLNVKDWHHGFAFFEQIAEKIGCEVTNETAVLNKLGRFSPPNCLVKMTLKPAAK